MVVPWFLVDLPSWFMEVSRRLVVSGLLSDRVRLVIGPAITGALFRPGVGLAFRCHFEPPVFAQASYHVLKLPSRQGN
jgi:hypothetical protein